MPRSRTVARMRHVQRVSGQIRAVLVAVSGDEPYVRVLPSADGRADALPSGPLESQHRTLELGLRAWIGEHTQQPIGYVEQLYTFGDRDRQVRPRANSRALSIGYLALISAPSA